MSATLDMQAPEQAIAAIKAAQPDELIIVDFDETLFLRNSTEAYLNAIYPRAIGAAFLVAVKGLKPWRWLPAKYSAEQVSRDWLLVVLATLLFPWTWFVWRTQAQKLTEAYWNKPLIEALQSNAQAEIAIASLGFNFIVNPLLRYLPALQPTGAAAPAVIACRFWQGLADRAQGKLTMVNQALGTSAVARAVVITDSLADAPLLAVVSKPCWVQWPGAAFIPAMSDVLVIRQIAGLAKSLLNQPPAALDASQLSKGASSKDGRKDAT